MPEKYIGKVPKFKKWNELFTAHLIAINHRWGGILKKIQGQDTPITMDEDEHFLKVKCGIADPDHSLILSGMYIALVQHTEGDTNTMVMDNGSSMSLETYRQIYYKGKNVNTTSTIRTKGKVLRPDAATQVEDIEMKINKWKADLRHLSDVGEKQNIPDEQRRTILLSIVPSEVYDAMLKRYSEFKNYDELEQEILDYVTREEESKVQCT